MKIKLIKKQKYIIETEQEVEVDIDDIDIDDFEVVPEFSIFDPTGSEFLSICFYELFSGSKETFIGLDKDYNNVIKDFDLELHPDSFDIFSMDVLIKDGEEDFTRIHSEKRKNYRLTDYEHELPLTKIKEYIRNKKIDKLLNQF